MSKKVIQEVQEEINNIKTKRSQGEEINEQDMEVLFLASLMEEEKYGSDIKDQRS